MQPGNGTKVNAFVKQPEISAQTILNKDQTMHLIVNDPNKNFKISFNISSKYSPALLVKRLEIINLNPHFSFISSAHRVASTH